MLNRMRSMLRRALLAFAFAIPVLAVSQIGTPVQYCGPRLTFSTALTNEGGATGFRFFVRTSTNTPMPAAFAVQIGDQESIENNLSPAMIGFAVGDYDLPYFRESVTELQPNVFAVDVWFPYGMQWLSSGDYLFALTAFEDNSITPERSVAFYWKSFAEAGETFVVGGSGFAVSPGIYPWRKMHNKRLAVDLTYDLSFGPLAPPPAGAPVWVVNNGSN